LPDNVGVDKHQFSLVQLVRARERVMERERERDRAR